MPILSNDPGCAPIVDLTEEREEDHFLPAKDTYLRPTLAPRAPFRLRQRWPRWRRRSRRRGAPKKVAKDRKRSGRGGLPAPDDGDDDGLRSLIWMRLADTLREDISPIECLSCTESDRARNRAACPCFATLHPFCDLYHSWLCHRLIDDGAGTCCLLPTQVIGNSGVSPEEDEAVPVQAEAAPPSPPYRITNGARTPAAGPSCQEAAVARLTRP